MGNRKNMKYEFIDHYDYTSRYLLHVSVSMKLHYQSVLRIRIRENTGFISGSGKIPDPYPDPLSTNKTCDSKFIVIQNCLK